VHGSRRDAQRERIKLARERDTGEAVRSSPNSAGVLTDWLATTAKARVRRVTHASYSFLLTSHVIPALGTRRLDRLRSDEVQRLYNALTAKGLGPRTVRYIHAILRSALDQAVRTGHLAFNPLTEKRVVLPRQVRKEMHALGPEEAKRFLAAAQADAWAALWTLLVTTGLRPGEAMGLKWTDLDGDHLRVRRTLSWGPKGTWTFTEPKTRRPTGPLCSRRRPWPRSPRTSASRPRSG